MPRTKIKYVSSFSLILLMKGSKVISILLLTILGGGTIIETLDLSGLFRMFFHFFTSGNWSFNILIVFNNQRKKVQKGNFFTFYST